MAYTTTELIASIKRRASIPTSQNLFSSDDFLALAQDELETGILPLIMSTREEYFVAEYDHTITASQASYGIPKRAIGGKLRDVQIVENDSLRSLARLEPELVYSTTNNEEGFYIRGNKIVLVPTPTASSGTLRLSHFRRPGKLVLTTACAQIDSIDTDNDQVTVTSVPSTFATSVLVDLIKADPGFECHSIDQSISGISGTTISFASLPSDLEVGDWIALAGESPIPQIPVELHPILAQRVSVRCQLSQGKSAKADQEKLAEMEQAALGLLSPRIDGEPRKIRNTNGLLNYFRRGR